jgi:hypothetical protein
MPNSHQRRYEFSIRRFFRRNIVLAGGENSRERFPKCRHTTKMPAQTVRSGCPAIALFSENIFNGFLFPQRTETKLLNDGVKSCQKTSTKTKESEILLN